MFDREPASLGLSFPDMGHSKPRQALIFLVEDELFIRMMIAEMVEALGYRVVAEASRIDEAQILAQTAEFDLALLDVNLGGHSIAPVAESIDKRGCVLVCQRLRIRQLAKAIQQKARVTEAVCSFETPQCD